MEVKIEGFHDSYGSCDSYLTLEPYVDESKVIIRIYTHDGDCCTEIIVKSNKVAGALALFDATCSDEGS